ncbi:MAG: restriction endonuclease subunit S [Alphaproteobacteria bacterium]|nr:restriction endonuclease subunit S [Alphaproteobacteria bacterium]
MTELLRDKKWSAFTIEALFRIEKVSGLPTENYKDGKAPYISTSSTNNGLINFVLARGGDISKGNCISVDPIKGISFYQPFDFVGRGFSGASINLLYSDKINRYTALFICKAIEKTAGTKASYGYLFNGDRLAKAKVFLPITNKGEPDYKFMEEYVKEQENLLKKQYKDIIRSRVAKLQRNLANSNNWKDFKVKDLFPIMVAGKSKGLNHLNQVSVGGINYLGATNRNNGVLCFVNEKGNKKLIQKGNCIAFIRNGEGSMGYSVYKAEDFISTSDITLGYNNKINRYSGMFITTIADRVRGKYSFNYKRSDTRLREEVLTLPVNSKGDPDYKYMEDYMRYLEQQKILSYLDYIS